MKFAKFFAAAAAFLALAACTKDLGEEKIELVGTETTIELPKDGGSTTVTFKATMDWTIKGADDVKDWLSISATSGKASAKEQTITIAATKNDGKVRTADLTIYGNFIKKASFTVSQEGALASGNGSEEAPYSVEEALAVINALGNGGKTSQIYVKGIVSNVNEISPSFGNCTFYISDDGVYYNKDNNKDLYIYRVKSLNNQAPASESEVVVGDEVVIYGVFTNYQGNTPETSQNEAYIYTINGSKTLNLSVSPASLSWAGNETDSKTVTVTTTESDWSYSTEATAWVACAKDGSNLIITPNGVNTSDQARTAIVKITAGATTKTITCTQRAAVNGTEVVIDLTGKAGEFTEATDATYGSGFSYTENGVTIAYYKHTSTTTPVNTYSEVRVYKSSALKITAGSKKISSVEILTTASNYTFDMPVEGGTTATGDTNAKTITWSGAAVDEFIAFASNGQVRLKKVTLVLVD